MELKPITQDGLPAALQEAARYRLLNDSSAAESICLDILRVEPESQSALVTLLLSITDQFGEEQSGGVHRAREVLPRLKDDYKRAYYAGIICERRAKAQLHRAARASMFWRQNGHSRVAGFSSLFGGLMKNNVRRQQMKPTMANFRSTLRK